MKPIWTILFLLSSFYLSAQPCTYDSIYVYRIKDVYANETEQIDIQNLEPYRKEYFRSGKKHQTITNEQADWGFTDHSSFYYNDQGQLVKSVDSTFYNDNTTTIDSTVYYYDKKLLLKKIDHRGFRTALKKKEYHYTYNQDTIQESIIYSQYLDPLISKTYPSSSNPGTNESLGEINQYGYVKKLYNLQNDMIEALKCDPKDNCTSRQTRTYKYNECGHKLVEGIKNETKYFTEYYIYEYY